MSETARQFIFRNLIGGVVGLVAGVTVTMLFVPANETALSMIVGGGSTLTGYTIVAIWQLVRLASP